MSELGSVTRPVDRPAVARSQIRERAVVVQGRSPLVGIETLPERTSAESDRPAFVLLNSGLVHHVGPNRLMVRIARDLAMRGFLSIRFDHSGVGDSPPATDGRPIVERWGDEIREVTDHLATSLGVRRVVVMGNCSGAVGAAIAAQSDARVIGAGLWNPPVPNSKRYLLRVMFSLPAFWRRMVRNQLRVRMLMANRKDAKARSDEPLTRKLVFETLQSIVTRGTRLQVVCCEWDHSYDVVFRSIGPELIGISPPGIVDVQAITGSNHVFSLLKSQDDLVRIVLDWAETFRTN